MFKVNKNDTWRHSHVFIVNFGTYFTPCSIVSIADFEQVNADSLNTPL